MVFKHQLVILVNIGSLKHMLCQIYTILSLLQQILWLRFILMTIQIQTIHRARILDLIFIKIHQICLLLIRTIQRLSEDIRRFTLKLGILILNRNGGLRG